MNTVTAFCLLAAGGGVLAHQVGPDAAAHTERHLQALSETCAERGWARSLVSAVCAHNIFVLCVSFSVLSVFWG